VRDELLTIGIPSSKLTIFPRAVDISVFQKAGPCCDLSLFNIPQNAFLIVAVGHAVPVKGWDLLVKAFAIVHNQVPTARLMLVGSIDASHEAETTRQLRALVAALRMEQNIVFAGLQSDVPSFLAHAQLFVMPSRSEGMGSALVEAQAAGLPCIGTATGGIPDVITDGDNGLLCPPNDFEALARTMLRLIGDRDLRLRLASRAREVSCLFDLKPTTQRLWSIYKDLLESSLGPDGASSLEPRPNL
jgi:glycosyltransferase involved in cell wall biosynthesis